MARRKTVRRGGGFNPSVGLVAAIVLVAVAAGLLAVRQTRLPPAQAGSDDILSVVMRLVAEPAHALAQFGDRLGDTWAAGAQVQALERENAELRQWRDLALALAERNARYEALVSAPEQGPELVGPEAPGVTARLVLDAGGPFRRTLLANAGVDHGVKRGYAAVNENGLVGRVVSVGRRSSRVLLLDDYNSRVPVVGQLSRVRAIVEGDNSNAPTLQGVLRLGAPRLENVIGVQPPLEGEPVVTSGDGGLYPAGLLVGYAAAGRDGVWRVRLAAGQTGIDFVRMLAFEPVEAPEAAPVQDEGPPLPRRSSREIVADAAPLAPPAQAPRRAAAFTPPPLPPLAPQTASASGPDTEAEASNEPGAPPP
jgi:rod shape-determining protein MreC